jgi:hypothetical protein
MSSPRLCKHYASYSAELLRVFVQESAKLYGPTFVVYNVHSLIHVPDDVEKFGCLDSISNFPFESFLGKLKRSIRKPQYILQQINNRFSQGCFTPSDRKQETTLRKNHHSGPVVAGLMNVK